MSTVFVSIADHMQAIVDHLDGLNIGYSTPPAQYGWQDGPPGQSDFTLYGIAWRIGSKDRRIDGLDGIPSRADLLVFIRCFGPTANAAEQHLDAVAARMLERDPASGVWALEIPGRHVTQVIQDNGMTTTENTNVEVALPEAGDFFAIRTDPA